MQTDVDGGPIRPAAWRLTAGPTDAAVPRIRHAVRDLVVRHRAPLSGDLLHGALLIVSELVTNAVRHAALLTPEIGVDVVLGLRSLRLAVEDGHPYRPKALEPVPEREQLGGRGLLLVRAIALETGGDCGVERTASGGKVVWATLPFDRV
ncbi:ATP-binding protein [Streptomyces sp. NBC_01803]|uniref:ATP-binding protein n=1 Tax=Streptomyces sp. NBC_01803 TaxID=2975946 RepID=UPI002DDA1E40|nr:ATP-binding protein [Streptomyces sp. NBC_01803]WSA43264.1 ATP-binding protein [Streptomyces sp. NBC_01803]